MGYNKKFKENVIKITNIATGEEDFALDVYSCANAIGVKPVGVYMAFRRKQNRIKNFLVELVSLDKFIKKDSLNG